MNKLKTVGFGALAGAGAGLVAHDLWAHKSGNCNDHLGVHGLHWGVLFSVVGLIGVVATW